MAQAEAQWGRMPQRDPLVPFGSVCASLSIFAGHGTALAPLPSAAPSKERPVARGSKKRGDQSGWWCLRLRRQMGFDAVVLSLVHSGPEYLDDLREDLSHSVPPPTAQPPAPAPFRP